MQSFYRSIMTMDYQLHLPDYLAKCINKDQPLLHCNGQCILMQKIKDKEDKETEKNLTVYEYSSLYVHKEYTTFTLSWPKEQAENKPFSRYLKNYNFEYNIAVFRPPIA